MELSVASTSTMDQVYTDCVFLSSQDYMQLVTTGGLSASDLEEAKTQGLKLQVGARKTVYTAKMSPTVPQGTIAMNLLQRKFLTAALDQRLAVAVFPKPTSKYVLSTVTFTVGELRKSKTGQPVDVDCAQLAENLLVNFTHHVFRVGQTIAHKHNEVTLELEVAEVSHSHSAESTGSSSSNLTQNLGMAPGDNQGMMLVSTEILFKKKATANVKLTGNKKQRSVNSMMQVNFEALGIGGLDKEFSTIFRRAFASRTISPTVIEKLGIQHVKGIMLHGPPGCGKTLIARQISKVLQGGSEEAREPKVVNGPEILSKFVGEAEKNIRELFADAEEEQLSAGHDSELHVIIFDEIDAICKQRGTTKDGTGVHDSIVNQLLSKIDGVNALHNILVIGMTNRLDMIDNALLRPGRFEVQIEIGLPDEGGRSQIISIHTNRMKEAGCLANDVSIPYLAKETKNFSGAEIEGLVKSATSHALQRQVNISDLSKSINEDAIMVEAADFEMALREVVPAFGIKEDVLSLCYSNGILDYGADFNRVTQTFIQLATQVKTSSRTSLLSVLMSGPNGCGKTALAAKVASESGFPFIKMITADSFLGMHENSKCTRIATVFEDAYKSPLSMIIIDDIERLIDFVPIGPRFSNLVLQTLLVLVNKPPPKKGRKLMIVGTSSNPHLMEELGLSQVFNVPLTIPELETAAQISDVIVQMLQVENAEAAETIDEDSASQQQEAVAVEINKEEIARIAEGCVKPIGIKKLLMIVEMARQDNKNLDYLRFMECMHNTVSVSAFA